MPSDRNTKKTPYALNNSRKDTSTGFLTRLIGLLMEEQAENHRAYDPNRLLDLVRQTLQLANDAALARTLHIRPPVLSKIRHRRTPVSASLLIRMHEETNLSIAELREMLGDRRQKFRVTDAYTKVSPLQL